MPIRQPSNRRVIPSNTKVVRTAREALARIIPAHVSKYDAAFQVGGYSGIVYHRLVSGEPCPCQSKSKAMHSHLNAEGKASQGDINRMILGADVGVSKYASREKSPLDGNYLEVKLGPQPAIKATIRAANYSNQGDPLMGSGLWSVEDVDDIGETRSVDTVGLPRLSDMTDHGPTPDEIVPEEAEEELNFDGLLLGYTEISCPVCFGSGFIGGFQPLGGYRSVLTFQHATLPATASIEADRPLPSIVTRHVSFSDVTLPLGVVYVDAFRVWNGSTPVPISSAKCDNVVLTREDSIGVQCDGHTHTLTFEWDTDTELTHVEIQLGYSRETANFAFPKTTLGSNQGVLENLEPFSIVLSPRVPAINPMDVLVESTLGKCLQVVSVPRWNDSAAAILGWSCEVRPTQPMEVLSILPRRSPHQVMSNRVGVSQNLVSGYQPQAVGPDAIAPAVVEPPVVFIAGEDLTAIRIVAVRPGNLVFFGDCTDPADIDRVYGVITQDYAEGEEVTIHTTGTFTDSMYWDWFPEATLYLGRDGRPVTILPEIRAFDMVVGTGLNSVFTLDLQPGVPA